MLERYDITPPNSFSRMVNGQYVYTPVVAVKTNEMAQIFVAGKTAVSETGEVVGKGDLRLQIRQVCVNIRDALRHVGADLDDVVRTVTYVLDIDAYYQCCDERYRYFSGALPTNTLLGISRLASPDMLVEIEAQAIIAAERLKTP